MEVEGAAGLEELCQLLNRNCNTQKYKTRYYKDNVQGMACFIYNSDAVTPVGAISLNKLADNYLPERKTAQGFQLNSNQERFILCCNHWKSNQAAMFRSNTKIKATAKAPIIPAVCRKPKPL